MSTSHTNEADPRHHAANIERMLNEVSDHIEEDLGKIDDLQAKALFETTRETLEGLITAFEHYQAGEPAWR